MASVTKKKRTVAGKRAPNKSASVTHIPASEILGVSALGIGLFLTLALLSYHPNDPSGNVAGNTGPVQNWMGSVGASLAEAMISPVGFGAFLFPAGLFIFALTLFHRQPVQLSIIRGFFSLVATGFLCLLLSLYPGQISFRGVDGVSIGGWVGQTIIQEMVAHLNRGGTTLVVLAGLLVSLQLVLGIEVGPILLKFFRAVGNVLGMSVKVTGQAVATGAGAVGQVAISGASNVGQRLKDEAMAMREASQQRRLEETAEEGYSNPLVDDKFGPEVRQEGKPPPASHAGAGSLKGLFQRKRREPPTGSDDELRELSEVPSPEPPGEGFANPSSREANTVSAGGDGSKADEGDAFGGDPLEVRKKIPARKSRKKPAPLMGPKIVKSKYMEDRPPEELGNSFLVEEPRDFELPKIEYLQHPPKIDGSRGEQELIESARVLEAKLRDYGVEGKVVEIHPGPVIIMYEYAPAPGVKVSKITNLANDLALALRAVSVRIVAPLPGKAAVGIEVPETSRQTVYLRDVIESAEFRKDSLLLPVAIGKDIKGKPYAGDLAKMPHLLVAGSTGAGKSVAVNGMLISLLYACSPEEVRLILVDPKMIEFSVYNNIPHLLMPVVIDPKKAAAALQWAVDEMTRRYQLLTLEGARNIASYNGLMEARLEKWDPEDAQDGEEPPAKLPYIVIVIDELSDLMMIAGKEVQDSIVRLAQMARAAGIHLVVATQRPSVDVITGLIKANFPARIAFKVSSKTDSRTILDSNGAEYLLGNGDMLLLAPGTASLQRLHGAFVSDEEVRLVVEHLCKQGQPRFEESLLASTSESATSEVEEDEDVDDKYDAAKMVVLETGVASISTIQRRLKIGYNRSARMVEQMAREGLIGPPTQGGKPREIYAAKLQASI